MEVLEYYAKANAYSKSESEFEPLRTFLIKRSEDTLSNVLYIPQTRLDKTLENSHYVQSLKGEGRR